jgi:hypothetical protein
MVMLFASVKLPSSWNAVPWPSASAPVPMALPLVMLSMPAVTVVPPL